MTDLTDFLLARIAEDEDLAREATFVVGDGIEDHHEAHWWDKDEHGRVYAGHSYPVVQAGQTNDDPLFFNTSALAHIAHWDPDRVRAECEAKRQIIALFDRPPARVFATDDEAHRARAHPDWEYETTTTGRKSGESLEPDGEGWVPNLIVDMGDGHWRNWERFDYTEEEYWRRPRVTPAPPPARYEPTVLRLLALPYADHPDYREEWRPQGDTP